MTLHTTVPSAAALKTDKLAEALHDGYQLTEKDTKQLALSDSEFKLQTWEDLTEIIRTNRLEDLKRVPSDLQRYIAWSHRIRRTYGSIQTFVLRERVGWTDVSPRNPIPFSDPADTKVLLNDWPYGLAPGIVHLVCWTKSPIPTILPGEDGEGDLTPQARRIIDDWVDDVFVDRLGRENVLWFKNWRSIQSVRSVEHVHVLVRGASEEFLLGVVGEEANGGGKKLPKPIGDAVREEEEEEEKEKEKKEENIDGTEK